ncbi:hypothetical protein JST97_34455 [bacterium]|nr:hypothetical protein [bacterium]
MIQKIAGGLGSQPRPRAESRPAEPFCASLDQACLSSTVVAAPESDFVAKEQHLKSVLDTSNLSQAQANQVLSELRAIPSQIWKMLARTGLRIVSLPPGQDLSHTSAARQFSPADYEQRLKRAGDCLQSTVQRLDTENHQRWERMPDAEMQEGLWAMQQGPIIAEELIAGPAVRQLGFVPAVLSRPVRLEELEEAVGGEHNPEFLKEMKLLNRDLLEQQGDLFSSTHRLLLLPYPRCQGQPVRQDHLKYLKGQNDQMLRASMGTNYWQSALVVVHQEFLPDPAPEAGHHRVMLHEVGHAIDHLVDRIQDGGYGQNHRQLVQRLFQRDTVDAREGQDRFSSPRAKDNPREYFAEAVESYLTRDQADGQESKPNNNHDWLKAHNPELFAHVDEIFKRAYSDDLKLDPMPENPEYKAPPDLLARTRKPYLEL